MARPLNRMEQRLYEQVQDLLSPDENIRAALSVWRGHVPGTKGIRLFLWNLALPAMPMADGYFTIVATDNELVLYGTGRLRKPVREVGRHRLTDIGSLSTTGLDFWLELGGDYYWTSFSWGNELTKLRRLRERALSSGDEGAT
jgi:hypothetical protein